MRFIAVALCIAWLADGAVAAEPAWIELIGAKSGDVWKKPSGGWIVAADAELDAKNARRLIPKPGTGVLVNGKTGNERDLVTKESFGDVEVELEFLIAKGSNSGVKFHSLYEIQILDSFGKKDKGPTGDTCGGIYPRAELVPRYRYIDKGIPPKTNASRPAGEWQKLHAVFLAPRFDDEGKKTANARLVKVTLNDVLIHDNAELKTPTGHNWTKKEVARAPLLLQGDHGPVAFRNVRVRPVK